jgi:hypothetical protein
LKNEYIEKGKHAIDTKSEKGGLTIAKLLKQQRKPKRQVRKQTSSQKKAMLKNLARARAIKKKLKGGGKK